MPRPGTWRSATARTKACIPLAASCSGLPMLDVVVVVPVFDHGTTIGAVVRQVRGHGLPCILVDDGSSSPCAAVLDALAAADPEGVTLVRLPANQGKGAAMVA